MFQEMHGDRLIYHEDQTLQKTIAWIDEVRQGHPSEAQPGQEGRA
jgi:hypothetical protein